MHFQITSFFDLWLSFRPLSIPHSGHEAGGLLPGGICHDTAARLRLSALPNDPCYRRTSPGNRTECTPPLSASLARRMSVMAIAERLVARVSFSQKLTGPERGTSKAGS